MYNQVESYITTTDKVEALQSQLKFCKAVLEQKAPTKDCFMFTMVQQGERLRLTVMKLTNNLKQLLDSAAQLDSAVPTKDWFAFTDDSLVFVLLIAILVII